MAMHLEPARTRAPVSVLGAPGCRGQVQLAAERPELRAAPAALHRDHVVPIDA